MLNGANNLTNVNPLLGKLRNYGGTIETMFPLAGSPVINKGGNPGELTTDARGEVRVLGAGIDIGAIEAR